MSNITLVMNDLPAGIDFAGGMVAIDTETTGLSLTDDKLCLVQVGDGHGRVWLVKFDLANPDYTAPNLRAVLENPRLTKLFHFARFDIAMLRRHLGVADIAPVYCTKIASRLCRPADVKHNLRALVGEACDLWLDKSEQLSNWAAPELTASQMDYAAHDVLHLHRIFEHLQAMITAQGRVYWLDQALRWLPVRVDMDLAGVLDEIDLFSHH
jgi:ribonuclease D